MKNINWDKVIKTAGIIVLIALFFIYFKDKSAKRYNNIEKYTSNLSYVSEELGNLKSYCYDARKYEDYEDLCISMYHVEEKCEELQKLVDDAYEYFRPND